VIVAAQQTSGLYSYNYCSQGVVSVLVQPSTNHPTHTGYGSLTSAQYYESNRLSILCLDYRDIQEMKYYADVVQLNCLFY